MHISSCMIDKRRGVFTVSRSQFYTGRKSMCPLCRPGCTKGGEDSDGQQDWSIYFCGEGEGGQGRESMGGNAPVKPLHAPRVPNVPSSTLAVDLAYAGGESC